MCRDEFQTWEFRGIALTFTTIILDGMHQPLPQAFPEYCVVKHPQGIREFRVGTGGPFRSRNGSSSSYYTGLFDYALMSIFPILAGVAWQRVCMVLVYPVDPPLKLSLGLPLGHSTCFSGVPNPTRILEGNTSPLG